MREKRVLSLFQLNKQLSNEQPALMSELSIERGCASEIVFERYNLENPYRVLSP